MMETSQQEIVVDHFNVNSAQKLRDDLAEAGVEIVDDSKIHSTGMFSVRSTEQRVQGFVGNQGEFVELRLVG